MKAQETTLQQLIQGEKQFIVPLYQRPYSWQAPQLEQLWDDIVVQAEALAEGIRTTGHFIGSVVLAPDPDMTATMNRWVVVDGQQRLTTLLLLLCALRDHLAVDDPAERERFDELYLTNKWKSGTDRLRLLPTQADRDAFAACINAAPDAGSGDGVGMAYRFFRRMLVEADDPADPHDIPRVEAAVRDRLAIVEITADKDDNVYRIFESLNNTGLRLSQADLVRNFLFMSLPTRGEEVYNNLWLPMQESLPADALELLMYLDLVLRGDERVRREDLYRGHQESIKSLGSEDAVVEYVELLARRAGYLRGVLDLEPEQDQTLRASLARIRHWGTQTMYPAVVALLERRDNGAATTEEVASSLVLFESFLVRRMLNAVHTANLNRIFQSLTPEILASDDVVPAIHRFLSRPRFYWPTDDELREAVRAKPFYWTGRQAQRLFVLRRLEESFPSNERADLDSNKITIEHVLPQSMPQEWLDAVAEEVPDDEDPTEVARLLLHTLGNLTLTGYNPELSNDPFAIKRELLAESKLELNRSIAEKDRWGPTEILERADDLADRAAEIWPGPDVSVREQALGRDWQLLHEGLAALPAGSWTTYSDLAELVGSHPMPVGVHIASTPHILNGHRAMSMDGRISTHFRWSDPEDERDPVEVLAQEGVRFIDGRADPAQRITAPEIAILIGLGDQGDSLAIPTGAADEVAELDERFTRFVEQLTDRHPPAVAGAVTRLMEIWREAGGTLTFGTGAQTTSCVPILRGRGNASIWPIGIYPGSGVEVCFQYLKVRPPFDDPALRGELRNSSQCRRRDRHPACQA